MDLRECSRHSPPHYTNKSEFSVYPTVFKFNKWNYEKPQMQNGLSTLALKSRGNVTRNTNRPHVSAKNIKKNNGGGHSRFSVIPFV